MRLAGFREGGQIRTYIHYILYAVRYILRGPRLVEPPRSASYSTVQEHAANGPDTYIMTTREIWSDEAKTQGAICRLLLQSNYHYPRDTLVDHICPRRFGQRRMRTALKCCSFSLSLPLVRTLSMQEEI